MSGHKATLDDVESASHNELTPLTNENSLSKIKTRIPTIEEHQILLKSTIYTTYHWLFFNLETEYIFAMVIYVWVLFAKQVGQDSNLSIGIVIFVYNVISGIISWLTITLEHKYNYSLLIIPANFYTTIGLLLCGISNSINHSFILLSFGTILAISGWQTYNVCILSYISKMLPQNYSTHYLGIYYVTALVSISFGTVTAGLIVYIFSYSSVYVFCTILSLLFMIHVYYFAIKISRYNENNIKKSQYKMKLLYDELDKRELDNNNSNSSFSSGIDLSDENERFPLAMTKYQSNAKLKSELQNISLRSSLELLFSMLGFTLMSSVNAVLTQFYAAFIKKRFNLPHHILVSTQQIAVYGLAFIAGLLFTTPFYKRVLDYSNYKLSVLLYLSGAINIVVFSYLFVIIERITLYWVYMIVTGFFGGILLQGFEIIFLDVQLKQHSGKFVGFKNFVKQFGNAASAAILSALWAFSYDFLMHMISILLGFMMICLLAFIILQKYHN